MKLDTSKYELIQEKNINELKSQGYLIRHIKTGARIVVLENDDDNKVFYVGFRTPPMDNTGVPHILEHSVLCGSKKYPVKEPFVELAKGSLNTFLNAMTYPDKTVYPVASCNDKDFKNIMDVYLDAVFNPKIYDREEIFLQEGWHYELNSPEEEIIYNGVVYNEMKGAFSSPDDVIFRHSVNSLYPDTSYGKESGGDPDYIPTLTYEAFKGFHKSLYHPSNSYIYLYGNCDMEERLHYLDEEYLSHYEYLDVNSDIKMQEPFSKSKRVEVDYSVSDEETSEALNYFAFNVSIGTSLDKNLVNAFQLLDYALVSAPGAPVRQALIDAGIGEDVYSIFESGIRQPIFSIIAKNVPADREEDFIKIIRETFAKIADEGINRNALTAGINATEFAYRESDFGRIPQGLMYGLNMLDTWIFDDNEAFLNLEMNEVFEFLKSKLDSDYYENLIREYFIDNTHASLVVLNPVPNLTAIKEAKVKESLKAYKDSLSAEEIDKLIADTIKLKEYQKTKSTPEELATIPMLRREDISRETHPLYNSIEEILGVKVDNHDVYTNGIGYLNLLFNVENIADEDISYIALLGVVMGYMDTNNYKYEELSNEIDIHTGGIYSDYATYEEVNTHTIKGMSIIKCKAFLNELPKAIELINEMVFESPYSDHKRLKEILAEIKSRLQSRFISSGHMVARTDCLAQFSLAFKMNSLMNGIPYYNFIADLLENFEEKKDVITAKLLEVTQKVFVKDRLFVSFTAAAEDYEKFKPVLTKFIEGLPDGGYEPVTRKFKFERCKTGYKTTAMVNYVARCGCYSSKGYEYDPSLRVLSTIMSYDYLWNNIRVLGGAYGCSNAYTVSGTGFFVSYRDPNIAGTSKAFAEAVKYVREFDCDEAGMTKYILGTFGEIDAPKSPASKGLYSLDIYLMGITEERLKEHRIKMLETDVEDIRALAPIVEAVVEDDYLCVIGNSDKITSEHETFDKIVNLF